MRFLLYLSFLFLPFLSQQGQAQSLDTTLRFQCAGQVKIAVEQRRSRRGVCWRERMYQLNGVIHLSIRDGVVINETRNFVRTGYVGKGRSPRFTGLSMDGQFVLYENDEFYLRFPIYGGCPEFMQKYYKPLGTDGSRNLWQPLAPVPVD